MQTNTTNHESAAIFKEMCKAKRRKSVAPTAKKIKNPNVRLGQERHAWRKGGLSPWVEGPSPFVCKVKLKVAPEELLFVTLHKIRLGLA